MCKLGKARKGNFSSSFIMSTKCDRDRLEYHNHGTILKLEKEFKL